MQSENLFASTYARTTSAADQIRDRKKLEETHLSTSNINEEGILPLNPPKPPPTSSGLMPTTQTDGPQPHVKHIPGYTGFVPGVGAENMYGKTYGHASHMAIAGDHKRFQVPPLYLFPPWTPPFLPPPSLYYAPPVPPERARGTRESTQRLVARRVARLCARRERRRHAAGVARLPAPFFS